MQETAGDRDDATIGWRVSVNRRADGEVDLACSVRGDRYVGCAVYGHPDQHGITATALIAEGKPLHCGLLDNSLVGCNIQVGSEKRHGAHRSSIRRAAHRFHSLGLRSGVSRRKRVGDALYVAVLQEADVQFAIGTESNCCWLVAAEAETGSDWRYARQSG